MHLINLIRFYLFNSNPFYKTYEHDKIIFDIYIYKNNDLNLLFEDILNNICFNHDQLNFDIYLFC